MTTTKTIIVFAIIFGCFAVLYPKIFHPMVLHIFGFGSQKPSNNDIHKRVRAFGEVNKIPPHLRKGPGPARVVQEDITRHVREEHPGSFRPGPHPGLRAAAEMKKQAAATTGTGKGMMGVVLPMYAVGIVIYLIYTLTKVFGKKEEKKEEVLSNNPFSEIQYDAQKKEFKYSDGLEDSEDEREMSKPKKQQRDLERLLLRADERNISLSQLGSLSSGKDDSYFMPLPPFRVYRPKKKADIEMRQLKARLMETEAQMSRILKAMETVSEKVTPKDTCAEGEEEPARKAQSKVDSSPDMDTYDIIDGAVSRSESRSESHDQIIEEVGPSERKVSNVESSPSNKDESELPQDDTIPIKVMPQQLTGEDKGEKVENNVTNHIDATSIGEDQTQNVLEKDEHNELKNDKHDVDHEVEEVETETLGSDDITSNQITTCTESNNTELKCTEERIPDKKAVPPQEPRPDLRKRKQGKKARRDN